MSELSFIRSSHGLLPNDAEAQEWMSKTKMGQVVQGKMVRPRNGKFLRKFFVMLRCAYDNYDWPMIVTPRGMVKCNFHKFRKDVTIMAGFYDVVVNTKGEVRKDAQSIAFANMDEAEFEETYSAVLDVILMNFLTNWERGDMDNAVDQMMSFA